MAITCVKGSNGHAYFPGVTTALVEMARQLLANEIMKRSPKHGNPPCHECVLTLACAIHEPVNEFFPGGYK